MSNNTEFKMPWEQTSFDNLFERDDRFFSLITKGTLAWLNKNIILYNKSINHFIFNTGSSYMYLENNGYNFNITEVTDQDTIYMKRPRCIVKFDTIEIETSELTQPNIRGTYERTSKTSVKGFNAEMRRMPLQITFQLHYVLSNFNESIVLIQELIHKLVFQKYFKIVYLGQIINCSLEIQNSYKIELNKLDMSGTDPNSKELDINITVCTNYPAFVEETESPNDLVISAGEHTVQFTDEDMEPYKEDKQSYIIE